MKCFLQTISSNPGIGRCSSVLLSRDTFSNEDRRLLHLRTNCSKSIKYICTEHKTKFLSSSYVNHQRSCCDPAALHDTAPPAKKRKLASAPRGLTEISLGLREKGKLVGLNLIPGKKLCITCKLRINATITDKLQVLKANEMVNPILVTQSSSSIASAPSQSTPPAPSPPPPVDVPYEECLDGLNTWLSSIGFSPISEEKLKKQRNYGIKVIKKIKAALKQYSNEQDLEDKNAAYFEEMIGQLKTFVDANANPNKKILALTLVPKSWSYEMISRTFNVSIHLARKSRELVKSFGILSAPEPKKGRSLPETTVQLIKKFFLSDDISRPLPGKKDVLSIKENGKREHRRKRLVLSTLEDLKSKFIEKNPDLEVSLAKFCELRPKECVLAGRAGTHVICVCTYHQNPILMFEGAHLKSAGLNDIKNCRELLLCPNPTVECFFRECEQCPDQSKLQETLEVYFDSEMIDLVTYNQWESTDRSNIVTLTKSTDDFTSDFLLQVEELITHDFIAKQQAEFYSKRIEILEEGEVVVNLDFSENFSFVIQESSQGFYFNNKQATIHPFVAYFKKSGIVQHTNFVIISDHMDHSTVAVHVFQKKLLQYLTDTLELTLKRIFYFSDGCSAQYKNKTAASNIWFHERDFGVPAEWHYYATSHGKSACDGVGGMIKHTVMLHCLRSREPGSQITKPYTLFQWVQKNIKGVTVAWVSTTDVKYHEAELELRCKTAYDIQGIKSHHAIIPQSTKALIEMKLFSYSAISVARKIATKEFRPDFEEVRGFVTFTENNQHWQLGHVSEINEEEETFTLQVLESTGKNCFQFSDYDITLTLDEILTLVTPSFQKKGQVVKLLVRDINAANSKLKARITL